MHAVRERITHAVAGGAMQTNPLRSDGGTDGLTSQEVWELVTNVGYSRHFVRFLAIAQLEREGVWPLNSTAVKQRVRKMTGARTEPNRQSVLGSMEAFEAIGALERTEVESGSGYHWTMTDLGRRLGRDTAIEWCQSFGFDEAVAALADESIDSGE